VKSGHLNLLRYDPRRAEKNQNPLQLDSKKPSIPFKEFANTETRFSQLSRNNPEAAEQLFGQAQTEIDERYRQYKQLADLAFNKADEK
jgi:pyruvate-ferredoxin/flavodoxin oxidoreductase